MAAREVIHFPFGAQLATRPQVPVLLPPEPVAESPPQISPFPVRALNSLFVGALALRVCAKTELLETVQESSKTLTPIEECRR
jgi:hypothetical protein